jgi:predicted enzyme related to lactoylglutathione lyase
MTSGKHNYVVPVRDLEAAKAVYGALFGPPHTDQPYYVGYRVGEQEIGLNPNGHAQGMTGPVVYWNVDDIEKAVAALVDAGGTVTAPARDVGGGTTIATVADAEGNPVGLITGP